MLVLTRKADEQIQIGNDVRVTVVRIGRLSVRLGIEAARGLNIVRTELLPLTSDLSEETGSDPGLAHILEDRRKSA